MCIVSDYDLCYVTVLMNEPDAGFFAFVDFHSCRCSPSRKIRMEKIRKDTNSFSISDFNHFHFLCSCRIARVFEILNEEAPIPINCAIESESLNWKRAKGRIELNLSDFAMDRNFSASSSAQRNMNTVALFSFTPRGKLSKRASTAKYASITEPVSRVESKRAGQANYPFS